MGKEVGYLDLSIDDKDWDNIFKKIVKGEIPSKPFNK